MDFEAKLNRLEEIIEQMEEGELALEQSLKLFEEGVRLSKECQLNLQEAEQKVQMLMGFDEQGKPKVQDFQES